MNLIHFLTITITFTIASGGKETESSSLRLFLDEHIQQSNHLNHNGNDMIHLPNGIFSTCGYPVISRTLNLEGMKTELHISVEQNAIETETQNRIDWSSSNDDWQLSIFRIRNSTVSLTSLCLNSEGPSSLIASVSSSFVTVSDSDIRSNGANSPFVMLGEIVDGQSHDIGSSLDIWKCRHISSSPLSLVPLAELSHKLHQPMNAGNAWTTIDERQFVEEISISASELAIGDSCLSFGTGPLIGFGCGKDYIERGGEQAVLPLKVSSLLIQSQIVNTTSTPSNVKVDELFYMELTQRVTSSRVCLSTNHLYGTACVDINANAMGSLLSLNTSFSSCLTDTPNHLNKHYTTRQFIQKSSFFKLCTFKGCSSSGSDGGAIRLDRFGSLRIEECSFKTCHSAHSDVGGGGTIFFNASTGATFIATSSSFVGCSSLAGGGSVYTFAPSSTLLNCIFVDSTSSSHGGCLFIIGWDAASTSSSTNCLFENCRTTGISVSNPYSGGALYFVNIVSLQLNFLNFRGNIAKVNPGNDIMFISTSSLITSETIVGCSSTSDSPRQCLHPAAGTDDHLPNPSTTATHVSCVGTEIDDDTAEFSLKMSESITGTVLVLIDNSEGTRTPTSGQAPNIERVLSFSFDDTDESSCTVSLGEDGLVQTHISDYSVVTSSFVGSIILSASCVLDENEENAFITISGSGIPSGILSVTLSDNTVLDFEFRQHQTTSKILTVPLTENSPKFVVGEPFPIASLKSKSIPSQLIVVPWQIKFSALPHPNPHLTTLKTPEYDEKQKTVSISLEGVSLSGTHKVTLSVNGTSETVTIDVLFSSSKGQLEGLLFDNESQSNVNMSYDTRYEVVGLTKDGADVNYDADLFFTMIVEPTRLVTMKCGYDEAKKNALIRMTGRALEKTSKYKVGLSISGTVKHTVEMAMNIESGLWEGRALLYPSSSAQLEYGQSYEVSSFQKVGNTTELFFEANSIEIIPEPSRLMNVESRDADGLNSTTVTLSTFALTDGEKYTLELSGTPLDSSSNSAHVVPLSFTATSQPTYSFTLSLYPIAEAKLRYGHNYSVDWMKSGDIPTIIETDACSFSTLTEPERLVKISCDGTFTDAKKKTITVTFESLGLKSLTEYSIVLKSTATAEVLSHTKTLKVKTDANGLLPSHTAVLFPRKTDADELEGQLEFGLTYTVDGFARGEDTLLYDTEHITLTTPTEPARLTGIDCTGSTDKKKKATLSVAGRKMTLDETYTLTLKVKDKTSNTQPTVDVRFITTEIGTGSAVLFSTTPSDVQLDYDTTYEVIGVTDSATSPILFEDGLTFTTIVEPTRLVTMKCGYDEAKKNALIQMTGSVLDTKKKYEIELNDSNSVKKTIEMAFNPTLSEWEGSAILYPSSSAELEYGMTYSVSGFKTKGESSQHPYEDLTITIENEPSRIEGVSRVLDGEKTTMIISLSGRLLKSGMGKIGVYRGSSKWTSDTEIVSGSDGKWKTQFQVDFSESLSILEYGSTYTLCGLDGSSFFVNEGIAIVVPRPPVVSSLIPELNSDTHCSFRVVMSGSDLPTSGSFTASFSESAGTFVISLSDSSEWKSDWIVVSKTSMFEFNKTYTLTSLIDSSSGTANHLLCSGVTMTTPLGPTLTGVRGVSLTGASLDGVSIVVIVARIVADDFDVSVFDVVDEAKVHIPLSISFSSCASTEGEITHSVNWDSPLQFGHSYEIAFMSSLSMEVSIPSKLVFEVPEPPFMDNISITPNSINTFIVVLFEGSHLTGDMTVTLTSGFSFIVTAESTTSAISKEIALGWSDGLSFNTPFTIQSIVSTNQHFPVELKGTPTFTTPPKKDPLSLYVDGRTGETSQFCGESTRPCLSVEVAWEIVSQLGVRIPTIGIVHSATLGSPIRIENGMEVLLTTLGNIDPKLYIPSSACEQVESGMIVVSSSILDIKDVEIEIDSLSPSFVLLFAENSNLTLKEGSFVGPQSTASSNDELSEEICEWASGILQLDNCDTSISDTKLNHLSFGAINMKNGSLTIRTSSFDSNSPQLSSFPSLRRNIICSDDGHIEIGGLNGGDGMETPSAWIMGERCNLTGKESITGSSFFVPSLISKSCNSSYTSKTKTFAITIVGTTLIPCGLTLEVFEKLKDGTMGRDHSFALNLNSTTSFSEKEIVISLSESSLPTFSKSLEWRGRLVFGRDLRTADSFLIQPNSSDRFSQALKDNMKWWIPVVVVASLLLITIIVILIVCIRRKQKKRGDDAIPPQSEMEEQIEVKVDEDGFGAMVGDGSSRIVGAHSIEMGQSFGPPTKEGQAMNRENDFDATEMGVTVIGTGDGVAETRTLQHFETLYDRLHTTKRDVNKKAMMQSIVCGLQNAARINSTDQLFACLTSRWILIDSNERAWLQLMKPSTQMTGEVQRTDLNQTSVLSKNREEAEESKRRSAPETANEATNIDLNKVLVFRLGLVLWEIETGLVPFRELDAVNAQRQIGTGILPRMENIKDSKLVDLLTHCLSFQPDDRPSLDDVGKELVEVFGDGKGNGFSKNAIESHVKIEH